MQATGKRVVQYPPGTGLLLALFPPGSQVVSLYILATITVFGFALLAVSYASSTRSILLASGFGLVAIYMMINPTKASYSMAPTMVVCALVGFLTAAFCAKEQHKLSLAWISEGANKSWCSPAGEKTGPGKAAAGRPLASVA
jgi:hypothetical protein